jgi:hypothetical protein
VRRSTRAWLLLMNSSERHESHGARTKKSDRAA